MAQEEDPTSTHSNRLLPLRPLHHLLQRTPVPRNPKENRKPNDIATRNDVKKTFSSLNRSGSKASAGTLDRFSTWNSTVRYNGRSNLNTPLLQSDEQENTKDSCNVFSGRWVFDNISVPLYNESDCPYMSDQLACHKHGRRDLMYQNWRWQPHGCDLKSQSGQIHASSQHLGLHLLSSLTSSAILSADSSTTDINNHLSNSPAMKPQLSTVVATYKSTSDGPPIYTLLLLHLRHHFPDPRSQIFLKPQLTYAEKLESESGDL